MEAIMREISIMGKNMDLEDSMEKKDINT